MPANSRWDLIRRLRVKCRGQVHRSKVHRSKVHRSKVHRSKVHRSKVHRSKVHRSKGTTCYTCLVFHQIRNGDFVLAEMQPATNRTKSSTPGSVSGL